MCRGAFLSVGNHHFARGRGLSCALKRNVAVAVELDENDLEIDKGRGSGACRVALHPAPTLAVPR